MVTHFSTHQTVSFSTTRTSHGAFTVRLFQTLLIHHSEDATRKFEKAFEDGKDIKITQYADTQQGAFTLSSLVEMDQHLLKDYHFQEMITDITKYLAPEYVEVRLHFLNQIYFLD